MKIEHNNIWRVGGQVRDSLLGRESRDFDFAVEGRNLEVLSQFFGHSPKMTFHKGFRTATVHVEPEMDFACTRSEHYPKRGKMPQILKFGVPMIVDLYRRDFTVNAIAENTLSGQRMAVEHALEDIQNRQLRVLHEDSFKDDPTRMLRAIRYAVDLDFGIHPDTEALMNVDLFKTVSQGRKYKEIECFTPRMWGLADDIFGKTEDIFV